MAQKTIQIADKPTLDEVATDVEALKAELASMSELVTTIGKKVGVVEPAENETVSVIGGEPVPFEVGEGSIKSNTGKATFDYTDIKKIKIHLGHNTVKIHSLIVDGNTLANAPISAFSVAYKYGTSSNVFQDIEIPCNKSIYLKLSNDGGNSVSYAYALFK